ncbi:S-adenosyl-L-methionine-dependent methyltransferase [Chaetomium strumarium]|uniref:DNA (cytosine-5-)-methyltransferase n=1 Tax=Chaetomium strumarium TaxID=1170767 RepID=A0AAJ0H3Y9_9PEZI|nr:S-adenosyl-L-methionine-dependent methyltransferase [Chaetomium strumarium]
MSGPFIIDDEDEVQEVAGWRRQIEEETRWAASHYRRAVKGREQNSDQVDGADQEFEDNLADEIFEVIDLTGDDDPPASDPPRLSRAEGRELNQYCTNNGLLLLPGMTVEVDSAVSAFGVEFLRIKSIIQLHRGADIVLRGWGFARTAHFSGMLPPKLNELVMVAEIRTQGRSQVEEQALMDVAVTAVKSARELRITNAPFPEHRFDQLYWRSKGRQWIKANAALVCRHQYRIHFHGSNEKPCEWALVKIDEATADPEYRILDAHKLNRWRGGKVPGGSHNPSASSRQVVDLESNPPTSCTLSPKLSPGQRYTAGDVFAGAGGASRGIERAGLELVFAVDDWYHAADSLRSNFPKCTVYNMNVSDLLQCKDIQHRVDILHLSPPCQFWSPAHTVAGKNDKANVAILFSCGPLLQKFRPRLFTLEQTFGLLHSRFSAYFNALLLSFTECGYSVRWKVVPLANYGVPQLRKRLIMIGSAPGEKLPPFPPATHSKGGAGGLKPWASPESVLSPLSRSRRFNHHKLHMPHLSRRFDPPKAPWDPTQLAKTITTSGGQNYHWDGKRDFTLLEYAMLQGFPTWHRFEGRCIKRQIGNAFAPTVVRALYEHLVKWLLAQDGFDPSARHQSLSPEVVSISLDTDDDEQGQRRQSEVEPVMVVAERAEQEIRFVGSRSISGRSEVVPQPAQVEPVWEVEEVQDVEEAEGRQPTPARGVDDLMDLDRLDTLSDTETVRGDEDTGGVMDIGDEVIIWGTGTTNSPWVLSD